MTNHLQSGFVGKGANCNANECQLISLIQRADLADKCWICHHTWTLTIAANGKGSIFFLLTPRFNLKITRTKNGIMKN